jgi:hypothetical protein
MLIKDKNLKPLVIDLSSGESVYAHKKWADKISDLISQLYVVIKLKHNLIIHVTSPHAVSNKEDSEKQLAIYFRQEDNKDVFDLTLELSKDNELSSIIWRTSDSNNKLRHKIPMTKTIRVWTFSFGSSFGGESYTCRTVKSSVEFLEQLVKHI